MWFRVAALRKLQKQGPAKRKQAEPVNGVSFFLNGTSQAATIPSPTIKREHSHGEQ